MMKYHAATVTLPNQLKHYVDGAEAMIEFDAKLTIDTLLENMEGQDLTEYTIITVIRAIPKQLYKEGHRSEFLGGWNAVREARGEI